MDNISTLRSRHAELSKSLPEYEALVADQADKLTRMNLDRDDDDLDLAPASGFSTKIPFSMDDLRREEAEVRELEEKRRALEERVSGMERDLGGLNR